MNLDPGGLSATVVHLVSLEALKMWNFVFRTCTYLTSSKPDSNSGKFEVLSEHKT